MTALAFSAPKLDLIHLSKLFNRVSRNPSNAKLFKHEMTLLLENGLIPQVDSLSEDSIADVVKVMEEAGIKRQAFSDLLATELARKYHTSQRVTFGKRVGIIDSLLSQEADSDAVR